MPPPPPCPPPLLLPAAAGGAGWHEALSAEAAAAAAAQELKGPLLTDEEIEQQYSLVYKRAAAARAQSAAADSVGRAVGRAAQLGEGSTEPNERQGGHRMLEEGSAGWRGGGGCGWAQRDTTTGAGLLQSLGGRVHRAAGLAEAHSLCPTPPALPTSQVLAGVFLLGAVGIAVGLPALAYARRRRARNGDAHPEGAAVYISLSQAVRGRRGAKAVQQE